MARDSNFSLEDSIPYLIYRISTKANQNIQELLKPAGLTLFQWRLLSSLKSRGTSSVGELAECCVMQHAVVSRNLKEMERQGLLRRQQSKEDQRVVRVSLTKHGEARFEEAHEIAQVHLNETLKGFSAAEKAKFLALLKSVQRNIGMTL